MSQISINSYLRKIAVRTTLVLFLGILIYIGIFLCLQFSEKKSQLNLQATYVANALRNEFINGNQIYLYEQCRSLAAQENIRQILIKKKNYVYCDESDESDESSKSLMISVTIPILFQPELNELSADNIAGTVTLGIDGKEMIYYAVGSLIGLMLFVGGSFIYIKRSYSEMQSDLVLPIKSLTDAMISGSHELIADSTQRIRIVEIQTMLKSYLDSIETAKTAEYLRVEKSKAEAIVRLANQVAHDIRSPLSVLNMLVPSLAHEANSEKCDLLILATQRIDKIAEDLLAKGKTEASIVQLSGSDIESLVLEKQMLLASQSCKTRINLNIVKSNNFKTRISKIDFERIISNLLNNAIEAISDDQKGLVELGISEIDNSTVLIIKDNGKGISADMLSKIGSKGFTQGKSNGNGLGVHHAKSTIENAGGKFDIQSKLGIGTTITVTL